jgi:hypothetical protein
MLDMANQQVLSAGCGHHGGALTGLFTPCTPEVSLLEAMTDAARRASVRDVVPLSPACSSFDQFRNRQQRGQENYRAVKSISGGVGGDAPHMDDKTANAWMQQTKTVSTFARGFFEGKPAGKKTTQLIPQVKGRNQRQTHE